jgi:hypothetical protein
MARAVEQNGIGTDLDGSITNPLEIFAWHRIRRHTLNCTDVLAMLDVRSIAGDSNTVLD